MENQANPELEALSFSDIQALLQIAMKNMEGIQSEAYWEAPPEMRKAAEDDFRVDVEMMTRLSRAWNRKLHALFPDLVELNDETED